MNNIVGYCWDCGLQVESHNQTPDETVEGDSVLRIDFRCSCGNEWSDYES